MKQKEAMQNRVKGTVDKLYRSVRKVIEQARGFVAIAANTALVRQNWEIGRLIVEDEQGGKRNMGKRNWKGWQTGLLLNMDAAMLLRTFGICGSFTWLFQFATHCVMN